MEILAGLILILGLGFLGKTEPKKAVEPIYWTPNEHKMMMRTCGMECKKLKRYNSRTGQCTCDTRGG